MLSAGNSILVAGHQTMIWSLVSPGAWYSSKSIPASQMANLSLKVTVGVTFREAWDLPSNLRSITCVYFTFYKHTWSQKPSVSFVLMNKSNWTEIFGKEKQLPKYQTSLDVTLGLFQCRSSRDRRWESNFQTGNMHGCRLSSLWRWEAAWSSRIKSRGRRRWSSCRCPGGTRPSRWHDPRGNESKSILFILLCAHQILNDDIGHQSLIHLPLQRVPYPIINWNVIAVNSYTS